MKYIEFCLRSHSLSMTAAIRAANRAFGITNARELFEANHNDGRRVKVTLEQFALFIAYRVEEGVANNRIQDLAIKVLTETPCNVLDLRK